ncbi:alpha/beta fold hydrolase [Kribbella antibiotica]|uniref:alpha/beta fold hydrolase n=1 Tax=Kribbella antibiotica TaxID=190195 RepID=UPI0014047508|nr:alpha/beta fold hydrolase [Kribbella antibiotica]
MVELTCTDFGGSGELLIVGPSLGTSVEALWGACVPHLTPSFRVVGWDLPGHGRSAPATGFEIAEIADSLRKVATELTTGNTWYAGVSVAGAVGFALAVDPGPYTAITTLAAAAKIGEAGAWYERADLVRAASTSAVIAGSVERWFGPGFTDRDPRTVARLLDSLTDADAPSYAATCEALARFDGRGRLGSATVPVLVAAGRHDRVVPPELAQDSAERLPEATSYVFEGSAHLPPAEEPAAVANVLTEFFQRGGR